MTNKLRSYPNEEFHQLKPITQEDVPKVARTMLEAYRGTVDQQEETLVQAILEVEKIMDDGYGPFITEASYWIEMNDQAAAVICINLWENRPLITEIYVNKDFQQQGLAHQLLKASMDCLYRMGYDEIDLYVTISNTSALKLYEKLGFTRQQ